MAQMVWRKRGAVRSIAVMTSSSEEWQHAQGQVLKCWITSILRCTVQRDRMKGGVEGSNVTSRRQEVPFDTSVPPAQRTDPFESSAPPAQRITKAPQRWRSTALWSARRHVDGE